MSENKINYSEVFESELKMIEEEQSNLDVLYDKIEKEIDDVTESAKRNRTGSSPLTFKYNMYANLTSVRSSRISLIKDRVSVKKIIADLTIKDKKANTDTTDMAQIATALLKQITAGDHTKNDSSPLNEYHEDDNDDLKSAVASALGDDEFFNQQIDEEEVDTELSVDEEEIEISEEYFVDENGTIYKLVDDDYEELSDIISSKRFNIKYIDNEVTNAIDTKYNLYVELIEFEE